MLVKDQRKITNVSHVLRCLRTLDKENLKIILLQGHFAVLDIDWLGDHI